MPGRLAILPRYEGSEEPDATVTALRSGKPHVVDGLGYTSFLLTKRERENAKQRTFCIILLFVNTVLFWVVFS